MIDHNQYPISVFWSDEDEGYIAIAPDLPGCSAFGETAETALNELKDAIPCWIEAMTEVGNPIPAPSKYVPAQEYSGKFIVRVPKTLHAQLVERAKRENVSLNQCVTYLLTKSVNTIDEAVNCVVSGTSFPVPHAGPFVAHRIVATSYPPADLFAATLDIIELITVKAGVTTVGSMNLTGAYQGTVFTGAGHSSRQKLRHPSVTFKQ